MARSRGSEKMKAIKVDEAMTEATAGQLSASWV